MIIAGEASGDMRAAGLAHALKQLAPTIKLTGIGGSYMREAGVECFTDITELAVIGIAEVIKNFSRITGNFSYRIPKVHIEPYIAPYLGPYLPPYLALFTPSYRIPKVHFEPYIALSSPLSRPLITPLSSPI